MCDDKLGRKAEEASVPMYESRTAERLLHDTQSQSQRRSRTLERIELVKKSKEKKKKRKKEKGKRKKEGNTIVILTLKVQPLIC